MGRARGPKREAAQRAWPPELEDLQRRGGMSPDWHEMWHGRGGGVGDVATSPKPLSLDMDDLEILERLQNNVLREEDFVQTIEVGATLVDPYQNAREYRGVIRISNDRREGMIFEGVTEYGRSGRVGTHSKVVYQGTDISEAASAVNRMIDKKLQANYEAPPGEVGRVDSDMARHNAQNVCRERAG